MHTPAYPKRDLHSHIWQIDPADFPYTGKPEEICVFLLRYAILAPSVHNTQPWTCKIEGATIHVYRSQKVSLRDSDPTSRQTYLSFGTFVANIVFAARAYGGSAEYVFLPEGYTNLDYCARVTVTAPKKETSPDIGTLTAITRRRNYRGKFTHTPLTDEEIACLSEFHVPDSEVHLLTNTKDLQLFSKMLRFSARFGFTNQKFRKELSEFIVPNHSKRNDGIPGYAAGLHSRISSTVMPILMRNFNISEWQGTSLGRNANTAAAVCIIGGKSDAYAGWLASGFLLQEFLIKLTHLGLAHSIWAAPIEVPTVSQLLQKKYALAFRPHITIGIGHATELPRHSARHPVQDILVVE